ncbi:hypothetical protein BHQ17_14580 [Mycolicibacterium holsaticum]|uniref:Uncharacterized protein n=1 Tax=Mycolicibacterium holsaticum TaxID=152142 RepID=A0A1E3RT68_9MYCO|nr:hypothetical protein BHQ17_14580 [Mycolicibacterium holsaticum]
MGLAGSCASTMSQVGGVADADQGQTEKLTELALSCIEEFAVDGPQGVQGGVRRGQLKLAMRVAVVEADRIAPGRSDTALAAAAALALIENAGVTGSGEDTGRIFKQHPDSTPVRDGVFSQYGLLVLAAGKLAEDIGLSQLTPRPSQVQSLAAGDSLRKLLQRSVDNLEAGQPADEWWDSSLPVLVQMLERYAEPTGVYPTLKPYRFARQRQTTGAPTDVAAEVPDLVEPKTNNSVPPPAEPLGWSKFCAHVAGTRPRVAVLVAVVTVMACIGLAEAVAPIPRALFGWQDTYVDSYPIPSLPPPVEGVDSPLTLPNTRVQLFFMEQGSQQGATDQTVNGRLPVATAAVMPLQYQIATFQVLLSKTRADADADSNLKLWVQAPLPMDINGATLMKTPLKESIPQPELNTVNGIGGKAVEVPSLDDGDVLYQFQVVARPDRTNNGYFCGYNAKFVQVMVRSEDKTKTSQDGVVTPYPLYVPRGEGC